MTQEDAKNVFEEQELFRLIEVAWIFDLPLTQTRLHLVKGFIPCSMPTPKRSVPSLFVPDDLLSIGAFYALVQKNGLHHARASKIIKQIPPDTWRDVRDGFIRYMVVSLTGEGGSSYLFDLEDLAEPATAATLIIDLQAIRAHVIQRAADTFDTRRQIRGF